MKIAYIQNRFSADQGYIVKWAAANGHSLNTIRLFDGEALPTLSSFDILIASGIDMKDESGRADETAAFIKVAAESGKSVLGIGIGAHLTAQALGARVYESRFSEIGWFDVTRSAEACESGLGRRLPGRFTAFHCHTRAFELPAGAYHLGYTDGSFNQGFVWKDRVVALQFIADITADDLPRIASGYAHESKRSPFAQKAELIADVSNIKNAHLILDSVLSYLEEVTQSNSREDASRVEFFSLKTPSAPSVSHCA